MIEHLTLPDTGGRVFRGKLEIGGWIKVGSEYVAWHRGGRIGAFASPGLAARAGTGSPLSQRSCACAVRKRASATASAVIERLIRRTRLDRPLGRSDSTLLTLGIPALVSHGFERRGAPGRLRTPGDLGRRPSRAEHILP